MSFFSSLKSRFVKAGLNKIFLSLLFIIAIILNLSQTVDTTSKEHIDKAFNRALIAFGIAKTLNGVISVAQGTEIAIQPAGIGVNLTPGQILDPVNDLIERFSWVMLASTTSLGIQKVFLSMSNWPAFSYTLLFFIITALIFLFVKKRNYYHFRIFILRSALFLIVLRFAVPLTGLASEAVYHVFLEKEYVTSTRELEFTADKIGQLNQDEQITQPNIKKKSVWESAKELYNSTSEMLDINRKVEKYKQAAAETTNSIVSLIVVFIFQTVIIPLIFIFFVYSLFKYILRLEFK
ncbi:MAG: hypothetical protein OEY78_00145 [Gammaproteobacteria bacterium]|nr:hypothetical protein [Gammaproteobacteria bacterium]